MYAEAYPEAPGKDGRRAGTVLRCLLVVNVLLILLNLCFFLGIRRRSAALTAEGSTAVAVETEVTESDLTQPEE